MSEGGQFLIWTLSVGVCFLLDWAVVLFNWHRIRALTKILAMLSVIAWTVFMADYQIEGLVFFLVAAQVFGLLGDFFLLLKNKWFMWGLGTFLVGHLLYLSLFLVRFWLNFSELDIGFSSILGIILIFGVWSLFLICFYRLFGSLSQRPHIWGPMQVYAWILSGMTALAFILQIILNNDTRENLLLPVGAALFTISDLLLAYSRFIKPVQNAKLFVRITYHLAQFFLAWGFIRLIS